MIPASNTGITHQELGRAFSARRKARGCGGYVVGHRDYTAASEALDWAAEENPDNPKDALTKSLDGFFSDSWAAEKRFPFGAWARDPGRWVPAKVVDTGEEVSRLRRIRESFEIGADMGDERDQRGLARIDEQIAKLLGGANG